MTLLIVRRVMLILPDTFHLDKLHERPARVATAECHQVLTMRKKTMRQRVPPHHMLAQDSFGVNRNSCIRENRNMVNPYPVPLRVRYQHELDTLVPQTNE